MTAREWEELDHTARQLGYELKDFDEWWDTLSVNVVSSPKFRTIKESYYRGVGQRVSENDEVNRLSVFIHGAPNTGKTYAAEHSVPGSYLLVSGGGNGKFDNLKPSTNAIIIDNDTCPDLRYMADNYICRAYRRWRNNSVWAGEYFIVTSNKIFERWVRECGIVTKDSFGKPTENFRAIQSRFYLCEIAKKNGQTYLKCTRVSERGTLEDQQERLNKFLSFKKKFNQTIAEYHPSEEDEVDYTDILEAMRKQEKKYD